MNSLASILLLFVSGPVFASGNCPFQGATVEECPAMYYPTPKPPGPQDPSLVSLLEAARTAVEEERAAVKPWIDAREAAINAKEAVDDAWLNKDELRSKLQAAAESYRLAADEMRKRRSDTDAALKNLLDAAERSYGVKPPQTDFAGSNISRGLAAWNPAFNRCEVTDADSGKCRLRTVAEHDQYRKNPDRVYATTNPATGQILFNSAAFDQIEPEEFAATTLHESIHWVDVMSIGGISGRDIRPTEKFRRERAGYLAEASFFRLLGLETKARAAERVADGFRTQMEITERDRLNWHDIRKNPKYQNWRGVQEYFQSDARGELDFDRETMRGIHEGARALDERLRQDVARRLQEARDATAAEERRSRTHAADLADASRCGIEPVNTWELDYQVAGRSPAERIHLQFVDRATFKATLLIVAACHSPENESPCNDAMETVSSRWNDAAFRTALELEDDSHEDTRFCVAHIARRLGRPTKFKKIRKEAKSYMKFLAERRKEPAAKPQPKPDTGGARPTQRPPRERDDPQPPQRPRCRYQGDWCK